MNWFREIQQQETRGFDAVRDAVELRLVGAGEGEFISTAAHDDLPCRDFREQTDQRR
ncbi:MAG: hypothetical protein WB709_02100 [Solirubrobacteraceae bacterium]